METYYLGTEKKHLIQGNGIQIQQETIFINFMVKTEQEKKEGMIEYCSTMSKV